MARDVEDADVLRVGWGLVVSFMVVSRGGLVIGDGRMLDTYVYTIKSFMS
jgi:hypothetical protein